MKLQVMSTDLLDALNVVGPSVSKRITLPILNNVVLEAAESRFVVAATNLEQSAHRHVGCAIDEYGATTLPYKPLVAWLKLAPKNTPIAIEREQGDKVTLSFGGSTFVLRGITAADYPAIPGAFDGTPYTERDEQEKQAAIAEREEEERQKETERQAEHDRIAALPDRFVYEYELGYSGQVVHMAFHTLENAVRQWYADYRKDGSEQPEGKAHNGRCIVDKFAVAAIRNAADMHQMYYKLPYVEDAEPVAESEGFVAVAVVSQTAPADYTTPLQVEARASVRLDGETYTLEPIGPPPGIPCTECGLTRTDDIAVTFAPSVTAEVPLQEQEEIQAAQRDYEAEEFDASQAEALAKIERARQAVVASAPAPKKPSATPQKIKLRFAYSHQTMDKFVQRAIRVGAPIRTANIVKHEGNLIEYMPVTVTEQAYVVSFEGGEPFPLNKSNVRYLECYA